MLTCRRAVATVWGRSSSIFHRQPCKLASSSPPALEIPVAEVPGVAGREGWKAATAGRVEKHERERERSIDIHVHVEAETAKPRIVAAITAGKRAGSSGGSPQIHRTPTQPGIGSPSPDTVSPGDPPIWGRK